MPMVDASYRGLHALGLPRSIWSRVGTRPSPTWRSMASRASNPPIFWDLQNPVTDAGLLEQEQDHHPDNRDGYPSGDLAHLQRLNPVRLESVTHRPGAGGLSIAEAHMWAVNPAPKPGQRTFLEGVNARIQRTDGARLSAGRQCLVTETWNESGRSKKFHWPSTTTTRRCPCWKTSGPSTSASPTAISIDFRPNGGQPGTVNQRRKQIWECQRFSSISIAFVDGS